MPSCARACSWWSTAASPTRIRSTLERRLHAREAADTRAAKVFEGMGVYSPTLGIIGAVLGLMAVMQNLDDPSKLGHGIAAAFTATVYGIGLANLFFLPVANKLKVAVQTHTHMCEMQIDGLIAHRAGRESAHHRRPAARLPALSERHVMARRRSTKSTSNHEAWAIPYGDLVTLLLAFFVVMYAISSVNEGKYRVLSDSLSEAFHGTPHSPQPIVRRSEPMRSRSSSNAAAPR